MTEFCRVRTFLGGGAASLSDPTGSRRILRATPIPIAASGVDELEHLQRQYRRSLWLRHDELRHAFDALCDEDATTPQVVELRHHLHRLTGSAGSYGHAAISQQARVLLDAWGEWLKQPEVDRAPAYGLAAAQTVAFADLLALLRDAAGRD